MSVSLALIPIAVALRVVMGKDEFEKWVEASQIRIATTFQTELELVRTVRKAGFDADKWGGSIKTHFANQKEFLFWEKINNTWYAVFAKSDSKTLVSHFIKDLETKAGQRIFNQTDISTFQENQGVQVQSLTYPTNFRDEQILIETLKLHNLNPQQETNGIIKCKLIGTNMVFHPSTDGVYHVQLDQVPDTKEIYQHLAIIDEDYKRCVQNLVYEKLKNRISDKGLTLENEEVLEDNSIVLTLNIKE